MKPTYADVLKNASSYLNSSLPVRLVPKAPKTRLSDKGLTKLRSFINEKPNPTAMKSEKRTKSAKGNREVREESEPKTTQPLILATASDWVVSGSLMSSAIYNVKKEESSASSVHLLQTEELSVVEREGKVGNPIEVYDESDNDTTNFEKYSVSGLEDVEPMRDFDVDVVVNNAKSVFGSLCDTPVATEKSIKKYPELDVSLRLESSDELRRAKRRMEFCFMHDYSLKMKPFERVHRPEYEGDYTFTVRVGIDDNNTVEIKDTLTVCKLSKSVDETYTSEEEYKPESHAGSSSDVDDKRRRLNREALIFDPEKQATRYNGVHLPSKIPVIEIDEKVFKTREYHWLSKYELITSSSPFNKFLNKFKNGEFAPKVAEFQGVRYRFLRVGTSSKLSSVKQYNQFVIGNNFTIFRLGMIGSPNVDVGVNARSREKSLPPPINKKYTIASLFWANELLKSQKAW